MMATMYTPEEIARRTHEFEAANRKDHARFVLGAVIIALLLIGGTLLALAD